MYNPPLIYGPIPPESNPPIEPQYYAPNGFNISAISTGYATTVTTTVDNNFAIGQLVRLLIPQPYGLSALNEQTGYVIGLPNPNQCILNISSLNLGTFTANPSLPFTQPQIIPIGDVNTGQINAQGRVNNGTFVPGSFINISPN